MAGIKHVLDPSLYPHASEFAVTHPRFSYFADTVAALVRLSHLSLGLVLLLLHLASIWATLFAAWHLAARCYAGREARVGAVTLLAVWLTLPIAGTSIFLMDPYVTARSLSTPCGLLALVGLEAFLSSQEPGRTRRWQGLVLCCGSLAVAAVMHLLMAAYALGFVLVLGSQLSEKRAVRRWGAIGLPLLAVAMAWGIQVRSPGESAAYLQVQMTRSYWFLSDWAWYEQIGLAAPLTILATVACKRRWWDETKIALARTAVVCSLTAVVVALLFARAGAATHTVAWLQPLRIFQITYILMILGLGAALGERLLKRSVLRWAVVFCSLGGIMLFAGRQTFPASTHLELPKVPASNAWERAFVWIRYNTPKEAFFALDPNYITKPGEDAKSFRAIAERSVLPDYSKDGGEAANSPRLASAWVKAQAAQTRLSEKTDTQRLTALRPLGVDWVVLERSALTGFACDYANEAVKVCHLPLSVEQTAVASIR